MTFTGIPSCFSGFIQDFLDHYGRIDVGSGSIIYMSGEPSFIGFLTSQYNRGAFCYGRLHTNTL